MDPNFRTLRWANGEFKFPCGITVDLSEDEFIKLFTMFKLEEKIDEMITNGQAEIPKGRAFQIKCHLT